MLNRYATSGFDRSGPVVRALTLCSALLAASAQAAEPQAGRAIAPAPARAVAALDALFNGPHAGRRAVHAKGVLCEGSFTPTAEARQVSLAPHLAGPATPVLVRFSNFSGVPDAADNDPLASPRGMAIKFKLPDGGETDIVAHSYDGFPVSTPDDFATFVATLASADAGRLEAFIAARPAARAFVTAPKPAPESYATESFFGVNAFTFTNAAGEVLAGRYRLVPLAGSAHLTPEEAARRPTDYLARDVAARLATAGGIRFRLDLQLADPGDRTADGSVPWPADRRVVTLGTLTLDRLAPDGEATQRDILFTPLALVEGILPSDDPMLSARSRAYRISHLRRAGQAAAAESAR